MAAESPSPERVNNFAELVSLLKKEEKLFAGYRFTLPYHGLATLSDGETTTFFVARSIWGEEKKLQRLNDKSKNPMSLFFYIVAEQEYNLLPQKLRQDNWLKIVTPISRLNFREIVASAQFAQRDKFAAVRERAETTKDLTSIKHVLSMSRQLNGVRDVPRLLHLILEKAREITSADAGSIYEVEMRDNNTRDGTIHFRFTHNYSVKQDLSSFSIPINDSSIAGSCVIRQESINVPDLYQLSSGKALNVYGLKHDKSFDNILNYRSHSMLTTPIFDISRQVIGVIQLLNRKLDYHAKLLTAEDFAKQVVPFNQKDIEHVEIVAQQSGIALENARMHDDIQGLFDGFVDASVTIIEQRDPTTSGHSHRVAKLTMDLAEIVNNLDEGKFRNIRFSKDQMKELRYAALLHDFGKIGVRENVLVKAKKLYPWQMENLLERFELIKATYEIEYLRKILELHKEGKSEVKDIRDEMFLRGKQKNLAELEEILRFVQQTNEPTVLAKQGGQERLNDIGKKVFLDLQGRKRQYLTDDDLDSLSISKGSLTENEFAEIQGHVTHTYEFLKKIPWGKRLTNIPEIAGKHHEKLDGSGYPAMVTGDSIPIQSRMMTIADIFDALTASDRPYKKSLSPENALHIMDEEVRQGKLDSSLFEVFVESKNYMQIIQKVD